MTEVSLVWYGLECLQGLKPVLSGGAARAFSLTRPWDKRPPYPSFGTEFKGKFLCHGGIRASQTSFQTSVFSSVQRDNIALTGMSLSSLLELLGLK